MPKSKILVVDDDQNLLELVKIKLGSANCDVTVVLDGEEALTAVKANEFDLAIVDLRLADQDGITLMDRLHALYPAMPVIILTGHASIESAVEAMTRGAYTYIKKPFDPHELLLQVNRALDSCKLVSENRRLKGLLKETYGFSNIVAKSEKMQR
ncbi:MAG TPA: response regulator, partial [Terriglobales bacterium]|nr:response regulator [Terriglobales bacterium]